MPRLQTRFIPTCVGNMRPLSGQAAHRSVHPHVCGEHFFGLLPERGFVRFIPTCVGNMDQKPTTLLRQTVHPHVCGEHAGVGVQAA